MEDIRSTSKKNQALRHISSFLKKRTVAYPNTGSVNLSVLVDEVITDYISQRPELKATFEVENNIVVQGDRALLKTFVEKLIQNSISFNQSSSHHSIIFGHTRDDQGMYFIMNNELGSSSDKVSFGSFNYLDKKDLGRDELKNLQAIITGHNGKFWGIGKRDVGSIFYFSIGL